MQKVDWSIKGRICRRLFGTSLVVAAATAAASSAAAMVATASAFGTGVSALLLDAVWLRDVK